MQDEDDVREVVGHYLNMAASRLSDLQQAVTLRDQTGSRHHAHAAKGAAKSVGADTLADWLIGIEAALSELDWTDIDTRAAQLSPLLDGVRQTLDNWVPDFD